MPAPGSRTLLSSTIQPKHQSALSAASPLSRRRSLEPQPIEIVPDMLSLAGLLNRELGAARRYGTRPAVLLLQVEVRPEAGGLAPLPAQQEELIDTLGARLRCRVRSHDVVARVGRSRYAVVLQNMARAPLPAVQARLQRALGGPYELQSQLLFASLRMGAALCGPHRCSGLELCQSAELAMEQAAPDALPAPAEERRRREDAAPST